MLEIAKLDIEETTTPLLSICVVTYNHERFIKEAIAGFLKQKVDFPVEILVHDDASTDDTQNILMQYSNDYPGLFKLVLQKENQHSIFGGGMHPRFNYPRARGKYIALCDGDDYWTDPHKLQKQIDFLEKNDDFSLCFTRSEMLKDNELTLHKVPFKKTTFTGVDFLKTYNFICTATVVFKRGVLSTIKDQTKYPFGDLALYLHASKIGKIKCLPDLTAVYRIHGSGVWSKLNNQDRLLKYFLFYKTYYPHATKEEASVITDRAYKLLLKLNKKTTSSTYLYHLKLLFTHKMLNTKISTYLGYVLRQVKSKLTI
jgi:glycosyltransferase involved in cell wall biosynthesis